jgi:DNA-binding CsgD family transcriptional regulator
LGFAQCLERVAYLAALRRKPLYAARFLGSAATIRRAIGAPPLPTEALDLHATATAVRTQVDDDAFAAAWATGEALPQEDAITAALAFLLDPTHAAEDRQGPRNGALPTPVATEASCGLTRREREVLALLCQHCSDAEIGDRLSIGVRTVEFHVTNILRKLGVENRHDAAALATQRGLL